MSNLRDKVVNDIISREGGYGNDPSDSGGETNFGITIEVARRYGYRGSMKDLPRATAFDIYVKLYWNSLRLTEVEALYPLVAEELADSGVNMGIGRAGRFLQRALNVLNNRQTYYRDLVVDGNVGDKTIKALSSYMRVRGQEGEKVLYRMLNALQGSFYVVLSERREKDEKFVYGWFLNRVD